MNYRPLIKAIGLLGITWMIFILARITFQEHTKDHLNYIPANADAIVIINNKKVGDKLFYQRVYHEEEYKDLVSVEDDLEKEIIKQALTSGIDILGPLPVFTYSVDGRSVVGIAVAAESEEAIEDIVAKYGHKYNIEHNIAFGFKDKTGILVFSEAMNKNELNAEVAKLFDQAYDSAIDQKWFEPLEKGNHDLVLYASPFKSDNTWISKLVRPVTPGIVKHSYTFVDLLDMEMSVRHEVYTTSAPGKIINSEGRGGYDLDAYAVGSNINFNMAAYNKNAYVPINFSAVVNSPKGRSVVHLDSLLDGRISFYFNGTEMNGKSFFVNGIPFDVFSEIAVGVNEAYYTKMRDSLVSIGFVKEHDNEVYSYKLNPALRLNFRAREDRIIASIDRNQVQKSTYLSDHTPESPFHLKFDIPAMIDKISGVNVDMSKLKDIESAEIELAEINDKFFVLEGNVKFKRSNHTMIEAMHIITNPGLFIDPLKDLYKKLMQAAG